MLGEGSYENSRFLKDFQREIFYFENPFIIHMCQKIFAPAARQEDMDFLRKNRQDGGNTPQNFRLRRYSTGAAYPKVI